MDPARACLVDVRRHTLPLDVRRGICDDEAGLVRFGARDYDPQIGRWVRKDPTRFRGGINLYAYAWNDPVNFVDRRGREPTPAGGASNSGEGGGEGTSSSTSESPPAGSARGGYTDVNVTVGLGGVVAITGGVFTDENGDHWYAGGGLGTPGICVSVNQSVTGSVSDDAWSGQLAGSLMGASGGVGYGGGSWFTEYGGAFPPTAGASLTGYYTW